MSHWGNFADNEGDGFMTGRVSAYEEKNTATQCETHLKSKKNDIL